MILTKKVKDLYTENHKTLMKGIEDKQWKDIPGSCTRKINIVQISILPKAIYRFISIPIKIPMVFLTEKKLSKVVLNHKNLE